MAYSTANDEYYETNSFEKEDTPDKTTFNAIDGLHKAIVRTDGWIELKMMNISEVEQNNGNFVCFCICTN